MIAEAALIALVMSIIFGAHTFKTPHLLSPGDETALAFGLLLLVCHLMGRGARRLGLPGISGYLVAGILVGPELMSSLDPDLVVLDRSVLDQLRLLDHLALGLIAFTAGGELRIASIRLHFQAISSILFWQSTLVFLGTVLGVMLLPAGLRQSLADSFTELLVAALILAVIAVATSPATTFVVIQEARVKGPICEVVLASTILKDVLVIFLFALVLAICRPLLNPGSQFDMALFGHLSWEIGGSLLFGTGLAVLISVYISQSAEELAFVMLMIAFLAVFIAEELQLSGLLVCLTSGLLVENLTVNGPTLMRALKAHSLPVYMIFFSLAGTAIDLGSLKSHFVIAILLVILRFVTTWIGSYVGSAGGTVPKEARKLIGLHFISQAGVSLGLIVTAARRLPGLKAEIVTVVLACIAINQALGPVLSLQAHRWSGEAGMEPDESSQDFFGSA